MTENAVGGDNTGIFSSGDHATNVQITLAPSALVRTQYHQQVRRIAPPVLYGRSDELAQLATFCASPAGYAWWRADAWSGKSALMSWFVLHPPPGVRIVSFFVTARLAAQNDRTAFVENVLEQLLALLGEATPPFLTDSTREGHLLHRLDLAARACRDRGEQFVLLVDGLDEDRGVHEHSIAALLPADLPPGMHVIVASRPNPPVPADVPAHHPLHDPTIVRHLSPSPHAQALRVEMEKDLKRLLRAAQAEQDLLGLVTAAGGGLSADDLAALTGLLSWEVEDHLRTVAGRSFAVRDAHFDPDGPVIFLLAHEELQVTALRLLGSTRLAGYRSRLRAWAAEHRARRWPADTPEYLLRGYFRLLIATSRSAELLACATDIHRQDRLLDLTGGDAAALSELRSAMDLLASQRKPDLVGLTRLAIHRDYLAGRNAKVPLELAEAWAALGNFTRAESIGDSLADRTNRVMAQVILAGRLLAAGERARALELLDRAEQVARTVTDHQLRAWVMGSVAAAVAMAGEFDRAERLVHGIAWPEQRAEGMLVVAVALAETGELDRALATIAAIEDPRYQAEPLIAVATALAETGDSARLTAVVDRVRSLLGPEGIADFGTRVKVLTSLILALARAGVTDHLYDLVSSAQAAANLVRGLGAGVALSLLAQAWAAVGKLSLAETVASRIMSPREQVPALVAVARTLASSGQVDHAVELLDQAMRRGQEAETDHDHSVIMKAVAGGYASVGEVGRAARIASDLPSKELSAAVLATIAIELAAADDRERATDLLVRAERIARHADDHVNHALALTRAATELARAGDTNRAAEAIQHGEALIAADPDEDRRWATALARAVGMCGDLDRAERLAASIPDKDRAAPLVSVAKWLADTGQHERAADACERAVRLASRWHRTETLAAVIRTLAHIGHLDRAERVARRADEPGLTSYLLAVLAEEAGNRGANELVERIARTQGEDDVRAALVGALAMFGKNHRAAQILYTLPRDHREAAWAGLAKARAKNGDLTAAEDMLALIQNRSLRGSLSVVVAGAATVAGRFDVAEAISRAIVDLDQQAEAWHGIAVAVAQTGNVARARRIAQQISGPWHRGTALLAVARTAPTDNAAVAEVITLADWHQTMPEVVASTPGALDVIFGELALVYGRTVERP